mmetsp:Transcript_4672/g.19885  ORF Transcript_4672/g.19885 Transcript_4672/m.19885 type:complete len:289 (+) Transcript_4672:469-1335(+)
MMDPESASRSTWLLRLSGASIETVASEGSSSPSSPSPGSSPSSAPFFFFFFFFGLFAFSAFLASRCRRRNSVTTSRFSSFSSTMVSDALFTLRTRGTAAAIGTGGESNPLAEVTTQHHADDPVSSKTCMNGADTLYASRSTASAASAPSSPPSPFPSEWENLRSTANEGSNAVGDLEVEPKLAPTPLLATLFATPAPFSTLLHCSGAGSRLGRGAIRRCMRSASMASFALPPPPPLFFFFFLEEAPVEEVVVATVTGRPLVLSPLLSSALSAANMDIVSGTRRWSSCR